MRIFYIICNADCRIFSIYFNLEILFGFRTLKFPQYDFLVVLAVSVAT